MHVQLILHVFHSKRGTTICNNILAGQAAWKLAQPGRVTSKIALVIIADDWSIFSLNYQYVTIL